MIWPLFFVILSGNFILIQPMNLNFIPICTKNIFSSIIIALFYPSTDGDWRVNHKFTPYCEPSLQSFGTREIEPWQNSRIWKILSQPIFIFLSSMVQFYPLRITCIQCAKTTKIQTPWYVLLDYFTTRPYLKKLNVAIPSNFERRSGCKIIKQNVSGGSDF